MMIDILTELDKAIATKQYELEKEERERGLITHYYYSQQVTN